MLKNKWDMLIKLNVWMFFKLEKIQFEIDLKRFWVKSSKIKVKCFNLVYKKLLLFETNLRKFHTWWLSICMLSMFALSRAWSSSTVLFSTFESAKIFDLESVFKLVKHQTYTKKNQSFFLLVFFETNLQLM